MLEGKLVKKYFVHIWSSDSQINTKQNGSAMQYIVPNGHRIPENLITAMTFISVIIVIIIIIIMLSITTKKLTSVR
jgi:hypothetical protein